MAVAGTEDTFNKINITVKMNSLKKCNNKRQVATVQWQKLPNWFVANVPTMDKPGC